MNVCSIRIYTYYLILFYIHKAILTQTNPKKGPIEKKHANYITNYIYLKKKKIFNFFVDCRMTWHDGDVGMTSPFLQAHMNMPLSIPY